MPARAIAVTSKLAVQERLPDLRTGPSRTRHVALHPVHYTGTITGWDGFARDVESAFDRHPWMNHHHHIFLRPVQQPGPHSLLHEQVVVGDEHGVQGRWQQQLGQVISGVLQAQGRQLRFCDFKASVHSYDKTPDVACITGAGDLRLVGELKTPWVQGHKLSLALGDDASFRHVLGQITEYMRDLNLKYGFISTYNERIFLRQHQDPTTGWQIQHSPVIKHDKASSPGVVTLRQCLWYLADIAQTDYQVNNQTPKSQWFAYQSAKLRPRTDSMALPQTNGRH